MFRRMVKNYQTVTNLRPNSRIQLTDPEGFVMSNQVIVDAFKRFRSSLKKVPKKVPSP